MNNVNDKNKSICIPRVENNISIEYIFRKLSQLNIGKISKIIEIPLKNDSNYKRIIVKIKNVNKENKIFNKLDKGEHVNIVHNMPWYWKIVQTVNKD